MSVRILVGDAREQLKALPDSTVHCAITSPPYFGLRDYGHQNQIGLEKSPDEYVAALVEVFREVRRVLRPEASMWVVVGDSYASSSTYNAPRTMHSKNSWKQPGKSPNARISANFLNCLKPKDLIGIPWLLAFALRADGWYLRSEVIWHKPACMPESVTDRPTRAHEQVFLFSKQARYYFDADAVRENWADARCGALGGKKPAQRNVGGRTDGFTQPSQEWTAPEGRTGRNIRSVWTIPPEPFTARKLPGYDGDADHYAAFPTVLVEPMVKAGTSERGCCPVCGAPWRRVVERTEVLTRKDDWRRRNVGNRSDGFTSPPTAIWTSNTTGWQPTCRCPTTSPTAACTVIDPFCGSGTTLMVADRLGRDSIGIDINASYARIAEARVRSDAPLFAEVALEVAEC